LKRDEIRLIPVFPLWEPAVAEQYELKRDEIAARHGLRWPT
jgi:hypothetical protein